MKKKTYFVKEIPIFQVVKTQALFLAGLIGLIGLAVILTSFLKGWKAFADAILGTFFGVFILSPVYGIVFGVIAGIYNWAARRTGGLSVKLEIKEE